jgi:hypothetical protein
MLQYGNSSGYLFCLWLFQWCISLWPSVGIFWCIMGALRNSAAPVPHDSLQY